MIEPSDIDRWRDKLEFPEELSNADFMLAIEKLMNSYMELDTRDINLPFINGHECKMFLEFAAEFTSQ